MCKKGQKRKLKKNRKRTTISRRKTSTSKRSTSLWKVVYLGTRPQHPRERLKKKRNKKKSAEVTYLKTQPPHPGTQAQKKMTEETKIKQTKNLFNSLIKDENSVFYPADYMNKTLINKAKMSFYAKDKVFENIEEIYAEKNNEPNLPLTTPF